MKKLEMMMTALLIMVSAAHGQRLNKAEAQLAREKICNEWLAQTKDKHKDAWQKKSITIGDRTMPFHVQVFDSKPADGYSLFISLHGGGNCPEEINDGQWKNQQVLYRPQHSVYIAPRAPYNDWDMWCKPGLDDFYQALIEMGVAFEDVNPDKVYLMGYSAGGDGVWRMAPRMADSWAAASMMAGHPGDVSLVNLRNLPYMIWCGARDYAYDRNSLDMIRGLQMDSLQRADPEGYIHETHIVEGKPHWMDRVDTAAVAWMAQYKRNPYPRKIVWQQEEVLRKHFYWLSAPENELKRGMGIRLSCHDNIIDIEQCDYSQITLCLNDELVNLDKKVTIRFKGKNLFKKKLARTEECLRKTLNERGDMRYSFPATVTLKIPTALR